MNASLTQSLTKPHGGVVLGALLERLDEIPAQRPVAARMIAMADDDNTSASQLAAVASADAALTAKLMRLANSAFYGLSGRVKTVPFAVAVLGFTTVRSIAVAAAAGVDDADAVPEGFWARSATTATAAGELARMFGLPAPDAFCLGLLSRIGQALLYRADRPTYQALLAGCDNRRAVLAAEAERYGTTHLNVSAAALQSWSFPSAMSETLTEVDVTVPSQTSSPAATCLRLAAEAAERAVGTTARENARRLSAGRVGDDALDALAGRASSMAADLVRAVTS